MTTEEMMRLLATTDYEPMPYSGRGMGGEQCVGVKVESLSALVILGIDLGIAWMSDEDTVDDIPEPNWDQFGKGYIVYWPKFKFYKVQ